MNWHEVATIIAAIVATAIALGGVLITIMKSYFMTRSHCESSQERNRNNICKKIDELKKEMKEDRRTANEHYAEVKEALGIITGKLDA